MVGHRDPEDACEGKISAELILVQNVDSLLGHHKLPRIAKSVFPVLYDLHGVKEDFFADVRLNLRSDLVLYLMLLFVILTENRTLLLALNHNLLIFIDTNRSALAQRRADWMPGVFRYAIILLPLVSNLRKTVSCSLARV